MAGLAFPKSRPRALDRRDRKRAEEAEYKRNAAIGRKRDKHCRICGSHFGLTMHHVTPRSLLRRSPNKHAVENLLTVCGAGEKSCHQQLTDKVLKVYATTDRGTNGPVQVERWSDDEGGYVLAMESA